MIAMEAVEEYLKFRSDPKVHKRIEDRMKKYIEDNKITDLFCGTGVYMKCASEEFEEWKKEKTKINEE